MKKISYKRIISFACTAIAISVFFVSAGEQKSLDIIFSRANGFYAQGKYTEAIMEYKQILEQGFESGNLYCNLGNCYFKNGNLGKAILNYDRAKRFIPRDADLKANYRFTCSQIKRYIQPPREIWVMRLIKTFFGQFTVNGMTVLLFMIYVIFVIAAAISVILKASKTKAACILVVLALLLVLTASCLRKRIYLLDREAIVLSEITEARFEPFESAPCHFTLYEGMKVCVLSLKEGWCKVERADDKVGWIPRSSIGII